MTDISDDPIESEDEGDQANAMELTASQQVVAHDRKILELRVELQKLKVERNRWVNCLTSIRVARMQMNRARSQMNGAHYVVMPNPLDAHPSPSVSSSGPSTQVIFS